IAAGSARVGLDQATRAVSGRSTHQIVGGPLGLPDSVYARLRVDAGIDSIAPVVEGVVRLEPPGRTIPLRGVDPFAESPLRGDTAPAQELLGRAGWIDRSGVRAAGPGAEARLARIRAALPPGARLVTAAGRADATAELSRAFEVNLTALALLALVFGGFLIYNS